MENLSVIEQKILNMCIKATVNKEYKDLDFVQDLRQIPNYESVLRQLNPLYINLLDGKDTQFDYTQNGYIITDYTIKEFNVNL